MLNIITLEQLNTMLAMDGLTDRFKYYEATTDANNYNIKHNNYYYNYSINLIELKSNYDNYKIHKYYHSKLDFNNYTELPCSISFKYLDGFKCKRFYNKSMLVLIVDSLRC